jgi:hypothetical protein
MIATSMTTRCSEQAGHDLSKMRLLLWQQLMEHCMAVGGQLHLVGKCCVAWAINQAINYTFSSKRGTQEGSNSQTILGSMQN